MIQATIENALYAWLSKSMGLPNVVTLTFDADFVAGNTVNMTINAVAISQVAFAVDQATTIDNLALSIQAHAAVLKAVVTGARVLTITGFENGTPLVFAAIVVAGGASQAAGVVASVQAAEGIPVIFAYQNAPRPYPYPYGVLSLESYRKLGWDEVRSIDENGIANIGGQRVLTVSVHFFGQNHIQYIAQAFTSLEKQSVHDQLYLAGIAILEKNDVQNVTTMLETKYELHSMFDFFIGIAENIEDDLGVIERVELAGEAAAQDSPDFIQVGPFVVDADIEP